MDGSYLLIMLLSTVALFCFQTAMGKHTCYLVSWYIYWQCSQKYGCIGSKTEARFPILYAYNHSENFILKCSSAKLGVVHVLRPYNDLVSIFGINTSIPQREQREPEGWILFCLRNVTYFCVDVTSGNPLPLPMVTSNHSTPFYSSSKFGC